DHYSSYKNLPAYLYQIQTKYRDEARPRAGLLRVREFVMKDSYSFTVDQDGLNEAYDKHRQAYVRIFERLGLEVVAVQAMAGAMGGSRSEEFLHPSAAGEDTFVESPGGYRANVEAVDTVVPEVIDFSDAPDAEVKDTPVSTTIAALVDVANELAPKDDGTWEAAETLKCVVLTAVLDGGERQVFVIAVPGDRDVDIKRLEAFIPDALGVAGEPEVEPATADDIAKHANLVPGYIGPTLVQEGKPVQMLGMKSQTGIPFFVDPRIVSGSSWVTGANQDQKHVFGLVAERDFTWDAVIEATAVRDGDPAPDGSGPLATRRGMEMGHIFQLGRKYAEALDLKVLDEHGKQVVVTMGSYGIGVSRAVAALAEAHHDDKGLIWPMNVAPAHVHIVATGKDEEIFNTAEDIANKLEAAGVEVLYDDRRTAEAGMNCSDAELIGVPLHLVVGRGLAKGTLELKDRQANTREEIPVEDAIDQIVDLVRSYQDFAD